MRPLRHAGSPFVNRSFCHGFHHQPDLILNEWAFHHLGPIHPEADAVAIADGSSLPSEPEGHHGAGQPSADVKVIDLKGRRAIPG